MLRGHFCGVVLNIFWNHEFSFVPLDGSVVEPGWLAVGGNRWGCSWVYKICIIMHTYIKQCVKIRRFWYFRFERNPSVSFVLIWVLISLSQILRHSFLTHFAGFTIDCIDREPWFICLSLHPWELWDIFSFPYTLHMCLFSFFSLSWTSHRDFSSERTSSPKWALSSTDSWAQSQDCQTHGFIFYVLFSPFSHRATITSNGVRMLAMPIRYCRLRSEPENSEEPVTEYIGTVPNCFHW